MARLAADVDDRRRHEELREGAPIASWRRRLQTRESEIAGLLAEVGERWPRVRVGSYPSFEPPFPTVEVVLKSSDEQELAAAAAWVDAGLSRIAG